MKYTYATVCSGVEGCSLALEAAPPTKGEWEPIFFSEIAKFPSAVLAHHWPAVPNLGDLAKIHFDPEQKVITNGTRAIPFHGRLDLLAGGTPCQDFSVAGKRGGGTRGSGTRSSLCWEWLRLVAELGPRVVLWENVPGVLSTNDGRDFAQLVAALVELGYGCAWRILDAQYTRVDKWPVAIPQRRRRLWLIGVADADVAGAAEILFEPESLLGRPNPERTQRATLAAGPCGGVEETGGRACYNYELRTNGPLITACRAGDTMVYPTLVKSTQNLGNAEVDSGGLILATLNGHTLGRKPENGGNSTGLGSPEVAPTETGTDVHAVAILDPGHCKELDKIGTITGSHESRVTDASNLVIGFNSHMGAKAGTVGAQPDEFPCLSATRHDATVATSTVRRLTPEECEALMGYPIGHTKIPYRGKPAEECPDGPRYEACGNGWAINCARWILLGVQKYLDASTLPRKVLSRPSLAIQGRKRDKSA